MHSSLSSSFGLNHIYIYYECHKKHDFQKLMNQKGSRVSFDSQFFVLEIFSYVFQIQSRYLQKNVNSVIYIHPCVSEDGCLLLYENWTSDQLSILHCLLTNFLFRSKTPGTEVTSTVI